MKTWIIWMVQYNWMVVSNKLTVEWKNRNWQDRTNSAPIVLRQMARFLCLSIQWQCGQIRLAWCMVALQFVYSFAWSSPKLQLMAHEELSRRSLIEIIHYAPYRLCTHWQFEHTYDTKERKKEALVLVGSFESKTCFDSSTEN